jgi:hypothetical protein
MHSHHLSGLSAGLVPLLRYPLLRRCPDGPRLIVTVEAEAVPRTHREQAVAIIRLEMVDAEGAAGSYGCFPILSTYSRLFLYRFLNAFATIPDYRERWRIDMNAGQPDRHAERAVLLAGDLVPVDADIAEAIVALNTGGFSTLYSCQGTDRRYDGTLCARCVAYVVFRTSENVPAELRCAARGAGFLCEERSIHTQGPIALLHVANHRFRAMLADWATGHLDESGRRYRSDQRGAWRSSAPYVPKAGVAPSALVRACLDDLREAWRRNRDGRGLPAAHGK